MPINYKDYHPDWKKISRFVRRLKAQNKCEICGVRNYSVGTRNESGAFVGAGGNIYLDLAGEGLTYPSLEEISYKEAKELRDDLNENAESFDEPERYIVIVLTVAHMDHDVKNNELDNLKALCQKCHNDHDLPYRKENRKKSRKKKTGQTELFDENPGVK